MSTCLTEIEVHIDQVTCARIFLRQIRGHQNRHDQRACTRESEGVMASMKIEKHMILERERLTRESDDKWERM